jgi:hypothetical protein
MDAKAGVGVLQAYPSVAVLLEKSMMKERVMTRLEILYHSYPFFFNEVI